MALNNKAQQTLLFWAQIAYHNLNYIQLYEWENKKSCVCMEEFFREDAQDGKLNLCRIEFANVTHKGIKKVRALFCEK